MSGASLGLWLAAVFAALIAGVGVVLHAPRLQLADGTQSVRWRVLAGVNLGLVLWLALALALLAVAPTGQHFALGNLLAAAAAAFTVGAMTFQYGPLSATAPGPAGGLVITLGVATVLLILLACGIDALGPGALASLSLPRRLAMGAGALASAGLLLQQARAASRATDADRPRPLIGGGLIGGGLIGATLALLLVLALFGLSVPTHLPGTAAFDSVALLRLCVAVALVALALALDTSFEDMTLFLQGRNALAGLNDAHANLERRAQMLANNEKNAALTTQKAIEAEKRLAEATLAAMVEAVYRVNNLGRLRYANPAALELSGLTEPALRSSRLDDVMLIQDERADTPVNALAHFPVDGACCVALRDLMLLRPDGQRVSVEVRISPYQTDDSGEAGKVYVIRDTTVERNARRSLRWQADHDPLTGLMNRRAFEAVLKNPGASRVNPPAALAFLDLDRFKSVNDTLGHQAGDALLVGIAQALRERLRERDVLARLGGDEFAILLGRCGLDEAVKVMEDVLAAVARVCEPYRHVDAELGVSIGVTAVDPRQSVAALMHRADNACYDAKAAGRNRIASDRAR